ncbi:MAG: TolC family protein [Tannerellaceae bacterium]|jgi:outer membrane protein TolC|nr:TolC family protein [Tannerellaceae bacterium]
MKRNIKYIRIILPLFIVCCAAGKLAAQETYNLRRCIETGLERNYSIRIIRNEQVISNNNASPGAAGYLPTLDLSGGLTGNLNSTRNATPDGGVEKQTNAASESANAALNLSWTIFDGFGIQAEYSRLKELKAMGELNTRMTIEDFIASLSGDYYTLIRQLTRLNNLASTLSLSRERLRIVEERYAIGSMSRLDLQQAQVDFNSDSSALLNQLETVHRARTRLNNLMAFNNPEEIIALADSVIRPNIFLDEAQLRKSTMSNNVSLLLADKNIIVSQLDLKKAQSRNYPYLRLNAGYGYTASNPGPAASDLQQRLGLNYGLSVGINLFDGFNRKREQRNAAIRIQNRELLRQELELTLKTNMSDQWMAYENNLNLWNLEKSNLVAAQENYSIALERYRLGDLSGIQLREAQNSLLNAEERQSIAEYATKLCEISLLQLSGQIMTYVDSGEE